MAEETTHAKSGTGAADLGLADNDFDGFGGEGHGAPDATQPLNTAHLGLWALLATLSMLFAGFTSAYLVRRAGSDWQPISMPPILWFNTGLLLSSSLTMELARTSMKRWRLEAFKGWLLMTTLLGLTFLGGQLFAWRQLAANGVYLPTNPHSSFFYMLAGTHAVHLLGGIGALIYALSWAWRSYWTPHKASPFDLCATYWHFVDGLWVYLFLLLFAW